MAMRLVLLGPPGSGKGTQAKRLAAEFSVPHIATGDLFRAEMAEETELGKLARRYIDQGNLVPDEVVNRMVEHRIGEDDCAAGYIMDGYPRTLEQADALEKFSKTIGREVCVAISLDVPDSEIVERAVGRLLCPECGEIYHLKSKPPRFAGICDQCREVLIVRDDDQPSTVRHRLTVYHRATAPVLAFYQERSLLREVAGVGTPDEVFERVCAESRTICYN